MIFMSHLTYVYKWRDLVLYAIAIWTIAIFLSGLAGYVNSFHLLLFSQMIAGIAESAFPVIAPPLIEDRGGSRSGFWMAVFCSVIPLGVVLGYIYSALIIDVMHWSWCYYILAMANIPIFLAFLLINDDTNDGYLVPSTGKCDINNTNYDKSNITKATAKNKHTIWEEMMQCMKNKVLCMIVLGGTMQTATTAVVGTFSTSFLLVLHLNDDAKTAAIMFGAVIALSGVLGSLFGGYIIDTSLHKMGSTTSQVHSGGGSHSKNVLAIILPRTSLLVFMSLCFLLPTCIPGVPTSLMFILFFFGWFFNFSVQTMIMISALHSVEVDFRPSAIGKYSFSHHAHVNQRFLYIFFRLLQLN